MTTPAKIVLGVAGLGAVGGGIGYGVHSFSKEEIVVKNSLKIKLTAEGFDTNVADQEWTAISTAHETATTNKFTIPADVSDKKAWLKNHCKDLVEKEDTSNYSKAIQWCVKKEKIVDILKKNNKFRTLNTQISIGEAEQTLWKDKITKLNLQENSQAKKDLAVTFSQTGDDAQIKEIQGKCKTIVETETIGEKFEENFKLAKDWCSITKEG